MFHDITKSYTGWPIKMSLFFFGKNFYKNKETFNIFSLQILEVYRILLVETTLELIMFYYTFSVINTMFVPCTPLLYDSTAATRTLKVSTTLLSISWGIRLISLLMLSSLVRNESAPWEVIPEVFKCSVREMRRNQNTFSNRTLEYLRHNVP